MRTEKFRPSGLSSLARFQPEGWPDIVPAFKFYLEAPFCFPVRAVSGRRTLGVGAAVNLGQTAWLAHIIVSREQRQRGIGTMIVSELLRWCEEQQCRTVFLIATDIGYPLYKKFGFRDQTRYLFFEKKELPGIPEQRKALDLIAPGDHEAILELDREVSGEDRRPLLAGHLERGFVVRSAGKISGYYLPSLGEGLVAARDQESGRSLLSLRCRDAARAVLPEENGTGAGFLESLGYRETRCAWRMVLGPERPWRPDLLFNRIGGNVG